VQPGRPAAGFTRASKYESVKPCVSRQISRPKRSQQTWNKQSRLCFTQNATDQTGLLFSFAYFAQTSRTLRSAFAVASGGQQKNFREKPPKFRMSSPLAA
jgi:hypothetical protein